MMRASDPSLTEQLLDCGVIADRKELDEVLNEVAWLAYQAEITAALPLDDLDLAVPPVLEISP